MSDHLVAGVAGAVDTRIMSSRYTCPCCGHQTLTEGPGAYDLCPVCYWEDDGCHEDDAASLEGPNGITLAEGQRRYRRHGTSALHCLPHVRPPREDELLDPAWRPLDLSGPDERQHFMPDFGELLDSLTETARRPARTQTSPASRASAKRSPCT